LQTRIILVWAKVSDLALAALPPRQQAVVTALDLEFAVRERLAALGLRMGRRLQVVRRAGARGPLQVRIDHTDLILRRAEADRIAVRLLSEVSA
jgi:ferrous iron transport protein A